MREYLKVQVLDGNAVQIRCMQSGCTSNFKMLQIRKLSDRRIQNLFRKINENYQVGKNMSHSVRWCPTVDCDTVITRPAFWHLSHNALCKTCEI